MSRPLAVSLFVMIAAHSAFGALNSVKNSEIYVEKINSRGKNCAKTPENTNEKKEKENVPHYRLSSAAKNLT
ncbi:MAG: hypothetical protein LBU73_06820 [Helicobacteraceae bacterium]|jgi:hypothetical protein|nr:hypothetical protein [Helicobacteraceae bacterium]